MDEVAPVWERGLKFPSPAIFWQTDRVAPVWERGLKFFIRIFKEDEQWSLPFGSVD